MGWEELKTEKVKLLLMYLDYYTGELKDFDDAQYKNAVVSFQNDYSLTPDSIAGPITQKKMLDVVSGSVDMKTKSPVVSEAPKTGSFWDTIKYFKRSEFACKCGGRFCNGYPAEMQEEAVRIADTARAHFGKPGHVVSGLRCSKWNAHEGGVANSQHMYGEAIDLRIDGVDSETLRAFVSSQPNHRYSYRINETNVHFDIPKKNR